MAEEFKNTNYKKKSSSTSIYFLLWSAFSLFALLVVLMFGLTQNYFFKQNYKNEIASNLATNGKSIKEELIGYSGEQYSAFVRYQARRYDLRVYVLDIDGNIIFPEGEITENDNEIEYENSYHSRAERLQQKLKDAGKNEVLYEDPEGDYVYGSEYLYDGDTVFLYVCKSLNLIESVIAEMNTRTIMIAIFVLILSFAVSSAISGLLAKPITEMTDKAKLLAKGDFSVDFQGKSYGAEMDALAETLNYARDELSRADEMQKELIANVSHDFKTPLTMIKAYASMIQEISGDIPEKRNKHTQVIIDEADRLTSLVLDVLDLSKIRSGINVLKMEVYDISAYTYEVIEKFDYLRETKGYKFITDIDDDLFTCADSIKIGQVLYNLIGNAVNYTGEDKTVIVKLKKLNDGTIRFSVTDTGKGIKENEITTIWDRYYRSSSSHKRPVKGTGLGLSIVKTILEKHEFRFGVESVVGKGSTFYVIFPEISADE